jgi:uncharacterized protein (DUF1697 family)
MTGRYVALLRGVNVGRANRVTMGDLRSVVASLGYGDPRTLLNSGNVVFSAPDPPDADIAARLEAALAARLDLPVGVAVLSGAQLSAVVDGNTLLEVTDDPSRLLVVFLLDPSDSALLEPLLERDWDPEAVAPGVRSVYAWCPGGVTGSPLLAAIGRALGGSVTTRNWATVLKLQALLERRD